MMASPLDTVFGAAGAQLVAGNDEGELPSFVLNPRLLRPCYALKREQIPLPPSSSSPGRSTTISPDLLPVALCIAPARHCRKRPVPVQIRALGIHDDAESPIELEMRRSR
jgi:hypothetical protein